jgi:Protein of unknown function (DUF2384)
VRRKTQKFEEIATAIADADALRENVRMKAFELLERQDAGLADMVLQMQGNRLRAARWMCMRHRALDGRSPYEALAEGDIDGVLDLIVGIRPMDVASIATA